MSLTILFQTPVDTGMANISTDAKNANLWDFYLTCPPKLRLVGNSKF
jgi:hypothetical protein